jgi:hypothetical protein
MKSHHTYPNQARAAGWLRGAGMCPLQPCAGKKPMGSVVLGQSSDIPFTNRRTGTNKGDCEGLNQEVSR